LLRENSAGMNSRPGLNIIFHQYSCYKLQPGFRPPGNAFSFSIKKSVLAVPINFSKIRRLQ
jgi:hypothetical protein